MLCTAALFAFASFLAPTALADIQCRVIGIADGDTLTCLDAQKRQIKVRLAEIDTPESKQPYGTRAKQSLSALAFGKQVRLVVRDRDRYGRTVARVYQGAIDVNAELIRNGDAWVYRQYSRDRSLLVLESEARTERRGLWTLPEAEREPPWEWRKNARARRAAAK